jgi:hypothetical protein
MRVLQINFLNADGSKIENLTELGDPISVKPLKKKRWWQ